MEINLGTSPVKSSDSDFADFQQAPQQTLVTPQPGVTPGLNVPGNEAIPNVASDISLTLIGDEDKYAALRTLNFGGDEVESVNVAVGGTAEDEDESWADFQTVETENDSKAIEQKPSSSNDKILDLFGETSNSATSMTSELHALKSDTDWLESSQTTPAVLDNTRSDWLVSSQTTPAVVDNTPSDWSAFSTTNAATSEAESDWATFQSSEPAVSTFQSSEPAASTFQSSEPAPSSDWGGFQETTATPGADVTTHEWGDFQDKSSSAPATIETDLSSTNMVGMVDVKKTNLQADEILGLFKVREPASLPASLKSAYLETSIDNDPYLSTGTNVSSTITKPTPRNTRLSTLSDDDGPPPIDDAQEDEDFGDFYNRGYDIEQDSPHIGVHNQKAYNFSGNYDIGLTSHIYITSQVTMI